jgi:signal transduction histidine kinase
MTGLLAVMLVSALALTYATLRGAARDAAEGRLERATQQLGALAHASTNRLESELAAVARDPAVRRALTGAGRDDPAAREAARAALGRQLVARDSGLTVELWSADGRRVLWAGSDVRAGADRGLAGGGERAADPLFDASLDSLAASDSARLGALYLVNGVVHFWVVAPVREGSERLGFVARQYRIDESEATDETIRALTGAEVASYYRNADGGLWTTLGGRRATAPATRDTVDGELRFTRPGTGDLLAAEEPIAGTPLVLVLEVPLRAALAGPRETIARLALLSGLLLLVGAVAAWAISRRITRPLAALTDAAAALAAGDYGARVEPRGDDELTRLATSFNHMAAEVGTARDELEMQTEEAQATAEELEESNARLAEAREAAESARRQAERASRAKTDFLAVMSHELRTPLNAIGGYTELLEMGLRGPITDVQRRDLGRIRASQQHLLGLISGLLDLNRIEARRVTYDLGPVLVDPFLAGLDSLVEPQAAAKSLVLGYVPCADRLAVVADREKLRQILLNLLSNAIRYTPAGGRITLAAEAHGDVVAITTRDTGVGIAADALERIFEPFVQIDRSLTSVREGVGLGLAISRDLARGMGGDITVRSRPGEGACFTLTLPRTVAREGEEAEQAAAWLDGGGPAAHS